MNISVEKYSFLFNDVEKDIRMGISVVLPYKMDSIDLAFKYLSYHINPLGYVINDWRWILKIFENKISHWSLRYLSLGGRLILIRSVLSGIPEY